MLLLHLFVKDFELSLLGVEEVRLVSRVLLAGNVAILVGLGCKVAFIEVLWIVFSWLWSNFHLVLLVRTLIILLVKALA